MRDHIRPYAGETVPIEKLLRQDPEMDAVYVRLEAATAGKAQAATLWVQFHAQVRMAQVARAAMRHRDATRLQCDIAAVTYGRHCDRMMDLLELMTEQQLLVEIGALLNRRGR